ncbi:winged helix-turn-helix transcriptional regulator [Halomonas sp. A29]|uniref:winged helix-turn-helix transcriptional regulator n=1 Tax=Halomonas sp. A29 TaxID=3102786 RepID=UPI00398AE04D
MRPVPITQTVAFTASLQGYCDLLRGFVFSFGAPDTKILNSSGGCKYVPWGNYQIVGRLEVRQGHTDECGFGAALQAIGGKWKTSLLWTLHLGPHRFAELRRSLPGISEKVLTQQLRQMEADGLISRHDYDEVPPHVEYRITAHGLSLNDAVTAMSKWGKEHESWMARQHPAA